MTKRSSLLLAFVAGCLLVAGCNSGALTIGGDAGIDGSVDGAADAGIDSGADACVKPSCTACRSRQDCPSTEPLICLAPGEPLCGGPACMLTPCNTDAFCQANGGGSNLVCDFPTCNCGGMMVCIPGCAQPSDCLAGQTCNASHHCVAITCGACPPHFVCGSSGTCVRQICTTDGNCGGGFCVDGECYDSLGMCSPIPA